MKTRRLKKVSAVVLTGALVLSGCDSTTSLDEVSLVGTWNGVGSLQTIEEGQGLTVIIQEHAGGAISGTWTKNMGLPGAGSITGGVAEADQIQFTLQGYPGTEPDPTFRGHLTDQHRMAGSMDEVSLDGSAVFRRRSVGP